MGVMLPKKMNKEDQAEYDKLNGLSGKDFDTEYLTYIVKAHWQTLHSFYMEATAAADPDLQAAGGEGHGDDAPASGVDCEGRQGGGNYAAAASAAPGLRRLRRASKSQQVSEVREEGLRVLFFVCVDARGVE